MSSRSSTQCDRCGFELATRDAYPYPGVVLRDTYGAPLGIDVCYFCALDLFTSLPPQNRKELEDAQMNWRKKHPQQGDWWVRHYNGWRKQYVQQQER